MLGAAFFIGGAIHLFQEVLEPVLGTIVAQLNAIPLAALCLLAVRPPAGIRRFPKGHFCMLLIGCLVLVVLNSRHDSKMQLIFSFLPLMWWALRRKKVGQSALIGAGLAVFYLFVVAPFVTTFRNTVGVGRSGSAGMLQADTAESVLGQLIYEFSGSGESYATAGLDATLTRMCDPISVGMIFTFTRDGGVLMGRGMAYMLYVFFPRVLWHEMTVIDRGQFLTKELGMSADETTATTSTGQTAAGELYWNFGWFGVLVGMYVVGAAISGLWWRSSGANPSSGVLEMTAFTGVTMSFVIGIGGAAGSFCVVAVMAWLLITLLRVVRDGVLRKGLLT